jgi:hypothetical protein
MILEGEGEKIYRFRPYDKALSEISENYFYFSDFETLNDPTEGFKEIFFEGDESDWKKLLLHFFLCFWDVILLEKNIGQDWPCNHLDYILNEYKIEECINKKPRELFGVLFGVIKFFLENEYIIRITKKISTKKIDYPELKLILEQVIAHFLSVKLIPNDINMVKLELFKFKYMDYTTYILNKRFKILAFSKICDCPLLWGHYAEGYRGVCLIFDKQKLLADLKQGSSSAEFHYNNLIYSDEFEETNWFEILKGTLNENDISTYEHLISRKLLSWKNEKEIRILAKNLPKNKIEYDYSSLIGIICGTNTKFSNHSFIKEQIKKMKNSSQVKFYGSMIGTNVVKTKCIKIIDRTDTIDHFST